MTRSKIQNLLKPIAVAAALFGAASSAQAHLVSFGWTDNGNGTVTLWGEHWHGDQSSAYSDNGGITVTDTGTSTSFTAQWDGFLNNSERNAMVTAGTLTGYALTGNDDANNIYQDWFFTEALVLGNGTWDFFTGTGCCVDTMISPISVTLSGITSVPEGTGPGAAVPEPASLALLGLGILGLGYARRKRAA